MKRNLRGGPCIWLCTSLTALEVDPLASGSKKGSFGKFGITLSIFNPQRRACSLSALEVKRYNPAVSYFTLLLSIAFEFDRE